MAKPEFAKYYSLPELIYFTKEINNVSSRQGLVDDVISKQTHTCTPSNNMTLKHIICKDMNE